MKNKLLLSGIVGFAICVLIQSCKQGSSGSDLQELQQNEHSNNFEPEKKDIVNQKLSPEEWLQKWNEAWVEIQKEEPQVQMDTNMDINTFFSLNNERTKKLYDLFENKYPELYSYSNLPEYNILLTTQAENKINQINAQTDKERDLSQNELNEQARNNDNELQLYKETLDRFVKDQSAPKYVP